MKKIAFLDRDGVINKERNYLYRSQDFEFTYGCIEGLINLLNLGFRLAVVTNQAGIGKGYFTLRDYYHLTEYYQKILGERGIQFIAIKFCPHHPEARLPEFKINCNCRKPNSGMFRDILTEFDVDITQSIMIGDKASDLEAARAVGIEKLFLVESGHAVSDVERRKYQVFENLYRISKMLKEGSSQAPGPDRNKIH